MIPQTLFPFKSYSVPLAKKIGVEGAAYLQLLMEKYGTGSFRLLHNDYNSLGINSIPVNLIDSNIIIRDGGNNWKIDIEKLQDSYESIPSDPRRLNGNLMNSIRFFVGFLKTKGKNKTVQDILNDTKDMNSDDLIESLRYSIDNGFTTIYRRNTKKDVQKDGRKNGIGSLTSEDSKRDYSSLLKEED